MAGEDVAALRAAVAGTFGHAVADERLLLQAATHASWCDPGLDEAERLELANERLEFLGDAVLGAAVALLLVRRHPKSNEGELSRLRARLVSRATLAQAIAATGLPERCRVGAPPPWPDSVKANLAEALLAAVFLDGGWEALLAAVDRLLGERIRSSPPAPDADPKSRLQAWALERYRALPVYDTVRVGGSDHAPRFRSEVRVGDHRATAEGGSHRRSETAAARALLALVAPADG